MLLCINIEPTLPLRRTESRSVKIRSELLLSPGCFVFTRRGRCVKLIGMVY